MSIFTFILELQTENLPAKNLKNIEKKFLEIFEKFFFKKKIQYLTAKSFSTPRKLAIKIKKIFYVNAYKEIKINIPIQSFKNISYINEEQLLEKFSIEKKIDKNQIIVIKKNKKKYFQYIKKEKKRSLIKILQKKIPELIKKINTVQMMRWNDQEYRFIRPVRNILALLNEKIIPFEIFGIKSNCNTSGHFYMYQNNIIIKNANQYNSSFFKKKYIILKRSERKEKILQNIQKIEKKKNIKIKINQNILQEVISLTEWPIVLIGKFKKKFLNIPSDILLDTLENKQKYFSSYNQENKKITKNFVFVSNIYTKNYSHIIQENENVLHARLKDIQFFFKKDLLINFKNRLKLLKNIFFQEKLGSLFEKTKRIIKISEYIAKLNKINVQKIKIASYLSKLDLTTHMISECPHLQGIIGMHYSKIFGIPEDISLAIKEHYWPISTKSELPTQLISCILSIADKLDTLCGIILLKKKSKKYNDPYALKRNAIGIIRIIIEKKISLNLLKLIQYSISLYHKKIGREKSDIYTFEFILNKFHNFYKKKFNKNLILSINNQNCYNILKIFLKIDTLQKYIKKKNILIIIKTYKRIEKILKKKIFIQEKFNEKQLYSPNSIERKILKNLEMINEKNKKHKNTFLLNNFINISLLVKELFEKHLINHKNKETKKFRINLLNKIIKKFKKFANFSIL